MNYFSLFYISHNLLVCLFLTMTTDTLILTAVWLPTANLWRSALVSLVYEYSLLLDFVLLLSICLFFRKSVKLHLEKFCHIHLT